MHFLIADYLDEITVRKVDIVEYTYVQHLLQRFENGEDYLFHRIWLLINLHRWFIKNVL